MGRESLSLQQSQNPVFRDRWPEYTCRADRSRAGQISVVRPDEASLRPYSAHTAFREPVRDPLQVGQISHSRLPLSTFLSRPPSRPICILPCFWPDAIGLAKVRQTPCSPILRYSSRQTACHRARSGQHRSPCSAKGPARGSAPPLAVAFGQCLTAARPVAWWRCRDEGRHHHPPSGRFDSPAARRTKGMTKKGRSVRTIPRPRLTDVRTGRFPPGRRTSRRHRDTCGGSRIPREARCRPRAVHPWSCTRYDVRSSDCRS